MSNAEEHSKLLLPFAIFIVFLSFFANFYFNYNIVVDYKIEFNETADKIWQTDLQNKILWHFPDWNENNTFTPTVGHCHVVCNNNANITNIVYSDDSCKTYPVTIYDADVTEEKLKTMTQAEATIPCIGRLDTSLIPGAHRGIFTKYKIRKGVVFGPYTGLILSDYGEEGAKARRGGYAWKILRKNENGEEDNFNIDAVDENHSNWLRWVNSARWQEEQNMIALLFNFTTYYMTIREVDAGEELLVWYGTNYAKNVLKIFTKLGSGWNWDVDVAPPRDMVICPTCPTTDGPTDEPAEIQTEEVEDHHADDLVEHADDDEEDIDESVDDSISKSDIEEQAGQDKVLIKE